MTLSIDERERRLNRCCKTCGKCMNSLDARKIVCSAECGHKGRSKGKAFYECAVCGKHVERYVRSQEKQSHVACSRPCQKVIAGRAGKDIVSASLKAKGAWHRNESARRRKANQWVQACDKEALSLVNANSSQTVWERKCASVSTMLRHRILLQTKQPQIDASTWLQQISTQLNSLNQKAKRAAQSKWALKCETTARNLRGRVERKQQRQS